MLTKEYPPALWTYSKYRTTLKRNGETFAIITPDGKNGLSPKQEGELLWALNFQFDTSKNDKEKENLLKELNSPFESDSSEYLDKTIWWRYLKNDCQPFIKSFVGNVKGQLIAIGDQEYVARNYPTWICIDEIEIKHIE